MNHVFMFVSNLCCFRLDDDFTDRLIRQLTVVVLVFFGSIVGIKQYFGQPMECWHPAEFTDSHITYANSVCWINRVHYHMTSGTDAESNQGLQLEEPPAGRISYINWIPFIFIFQAVHILIPCLLWRCGNRLSGINLAAILNSARHSIQTPYPEMKEKATKQIVNRMDRYLRTQEEYRTIFFCLGGRMYGNYLIAIYLVMKLLYVNIIVNQLFLLDKFVFLHRFYSIQFLHSLVQGKEFPLPRLFPKLVFCEFNIRHLSRVHHYTLQCTLPINTLTENLFVITWFWLAVLLFVMIISSCFWFVRLFYSPGNIQYVREQLTLPSEQESGLISQFTTNYLRHDGIFILRLIGMNIDEGLAGEIVDELWNNYKQEQAGKSGGTERIMAQNYFRPAAPIESGQPMEVM